MPWQCHTIQKSGQLKTLESHFSYFWLHLRFRVTVKFYNSNLTNLADVECLHENAKRILWGSDMVYTLFMLCL